MGDGEQFAEDETKPYCQERNVKGHENKLLNGPKISKEGKEHLVLVCI